MSDIEDIWNPTRRLYELFVVAKMHGRTMGLNGHARPIRKILGIVLKIDESKTLEVYRGLKSLSDALDWTETQIANSPFKQKGNLTRNLPALRKALEIGNINDSWTSFDNYLSDEAMADLLHAADRLSELHGEENLSDNEIGELARELQGLIEMFLQSDIDADLRVAILDVLNTSSEILSEYRIRGAEVLKKIVEVALGRLITKQDKFRNSDRSQMEKLLSWLDKLDKLYGRLGKYSTFLPNAVGLLLSDKGE